MVIIVVIVITVITVILVITPYPGGHGVAPDEDHAQCDTI